MNKFDKHFWIPYLVLLAMVLIRLIPFFYPESRTWGFNHLIFLPTGYSIIYILLAVIALILPFLKKSEVWSNSTVEWFYYNFLDGPKRYINRMIFIAMMAALFIIFAAPTHFLGDSYAHLNILEKVSGVYVEWDQTAVFKWSEIGISKFMILLKLITGGYEEGGALLAFQIVSVLSGVITIWFLFQISSIASTSKIKQILIFGSSLLSGTLLLFFGYAEYYHIIWAFQCAYIYYCLRFIKESRGITAVWSILIIGTALHLQMAIFAPATLFVTFSSGRGLILFNKYKKLIISILSITVLSIIALTIYKYTTDLYIEDMFLKLFQGKPIDPKYAIFSPSHLLDIANEFFLISPLIFLLLVVSIKNIKSIIWNKRLIFLGLSSIGCLMFIFAIDPLLGMPRDWDLFSLTCFAPMIFSVLLLPPNSINSLKRFIISMMILISIGLLPFLITNLKKEESIDYFKYLMDLDPPKALYAFVCLADSYRSKGQIDKTDSLTIIFNKKFPQLKQYNRVMKALDDGNLNLSRSILNRIKPNKYDGDYQRVWGRYYYMSGDYNKSLEHLDKAIQLRKYNSIYRWQRAMTYVALSKNDKALDDLLRAYDLDNSSKRVLDGLSYMYYSNKKYDSSIFYGKKLLKLDSNQVGAYYIMANSYYQKRDKRNSVKFASYFISKTENIKMYSRQRDEMINMVNTLQNRNSTP